jgi:gamma-tubulin complex component 6
MLIFDEEIFESFTDNDENDLIMTESSGNNSILFSFSYINLDEILKRLLIRPIEVQTSFVNKSLINYFFQKLNIEEHFIALRKYFLFENCEFAFTFVSYLCTKIFSNGEQKPTYSRKMNLVEIFNATNINEALNAAKSSIKNCKYIDSLSICISEEINSESLQDSSNSSKIEDLSGGLDSTNLQYCSEVLSYFNNLELKYTLAWPLNIVITDLCLKKYNQVFCFLLQIKFCHITLNNIWLSLKRVGKSTENSLIFSLFSCFSKI